MASTIGVSTNDGCSELQRMRSPCFAQCSAIDLLSKRTAPFDAQ